MNRLALLMQEIMDIESVSGNEGRLADLVEARLAAHPHLELHRDGDCVVARTTLGRAERVVIAGHLDTVPVAGNLPSRLIEHPDGARIWGRGASDMKGGVAVMLTLAAELSAPSRDITWIFYDHEEVEAAANGLGRLSRGRPDLVAADFAVLMEPTNAQIEGGCQGTIRAEITTTGVAAHSARSWLGHNAIHDMADVLERVRSIEVGEVEVEGLVYREGLNATMISGGLAPNVVPDSCTVQVNYRFAPDKTAEQALAKLSGWLADWELTVRDLSSAARPGLDRPAAADFVRAVGGQPRAKYGWTDVARFSELGIPAVNFGPADPGKAHKVDECCPLSDLETCLAALQRWLTG